MDLQFSPDLDARWCYLVLAVVAGLSAWRQLDKLLNPMVSKSLTTFQGWKLYGAYFFIPIALFWFLDRTGAIHDTSLFAAIMVGIAYDRILAGEISSMTIPGAPSSMWKPFTSWADRVTTDIKRSLFNHDQAIINRAIAGIVNDPSKMRPLEELVKSRLSDLAPMLAEVTEIDKLAPDPKPAWVLEKRARALFKYASAFSNWKSLLAEYKVTGHAWPIERVLITIAISVIVLVFPVLPLVVFVSSFAATDGRVHYNAWRLVKPNTSEKDLSRARTAFLRLLEDKSQRFLIREPAGAFALRHLIIDLRTPGLPSERVELILGMILETRQSLGPSSDLANPLIDALRVVSVDSRTRILRTLRTLAEHDGVKLSEALATKWQPTDGDSIDDLDRYIVSLKQAWNAPTETMTDAPVETDKKE